MYDFVRSRQNLRTVLEDNGELEGYSVLMQIDRALNNAFKLSPDFPNEEATVVLDSSFVLAVQQYVTLFGCHLEYKHRVNNSSNRYIVVPNWK